MTFSSPTVQRVQEALRALGGGHEVVDLGLSARTAADAAKAVGCRVDQIAKSLVFRLRDSGRPLLVITSGVHRVNEATVATLVGEAIERADADFVRAETGFAIGGVAPVGHTRPVLTLIDEHLLDFEEIWAAGGHPNTVFRLRPDELVMMTGGRVAAVAR
jgi:prolyl-tRNA editing enzyme YbaK/EbsC (Cys-tRNA(Pro) deacylase)